MPRFARPIVALVCLAVLALPAAALTDDDVSVDYRDGTYIGSLSARTPAPMPLVMAVLTDFNRMTDFMPGLTSSRIIVHSGNQYQIEQKGKISFGPFSIPFESLRQIEIIDGKRIISKSLAGSARRMQSVMQVQALESGSQIDYRIEIEPASWIPSSLGINFLQHELAEQFNALGKEMLRRK